MSIPATCPGCKASYQLADTLRGKKIRCKSCSEVFVVRGKTPTPDRDDFEERIQSSPRVATRVTRDEEDADVARPQLRRRPRKKQSNSAVLPLLIVACVVLGVLVVGVGGVAVWALTRSRQPDPASISQTAQAPAPPQNQGEMPPPPMLPPVQNPMPPNGPIAVQLTNANISGFGARIQVTVDYRFSSGNPDGRRLFLFIKATKAGGLLQNYYLAELRSIGNRTQGKINAAGMTFGLEHGPFEIWMGEGAPGIGLPLMAERDVKKISNVVTVAGKQPGLPGMPGMPGIGPPAGFPGRRPPIGPRGIRP
jgi:predicted Zn finger-like uncharacterized protein